MESAVGIVIVVLLIPGWVALELLGYPKAEIFQNLVYWACVLLILCVHELSKRTEKTAEEARALRAEMDGARDEIRRLQTDLREFQTDPRSSRPPLRGQGAPGAPSGPSARPGPWDRVGGQ